jgi:cathepsin L
MKAALNKYGPLAAAVHTTSDLQFYSASRGRRGSDIIDIPSCSKQVDHAITIVGYGTESGKDYWRMLFSYLI